MADFVQEIHSATLGEKLVSQGKVYFQKPGKMRWEFISPEPQLVILDGRFLWFYQPRQKQVLKTPLHQAFRSHTPIAFLTGVGRLTEDFSIAWIHQSDEAYRLRLTPRNPEELPGTSLEIEVDRQTYEMVRIDLRDALGNQTRLSFSQIHHPTSLDETLFRFVVPPGADVVQPLPPHPEGEKSP